MAKITKRTNASGSISFCVDCGLINGKRHRKFFKTKEQAKSYVKTAEKSKDTHGLLAFALSSKQLVEAEQAFQRLSQHNCDKTGTLLEAIEFYLRHTKPKGGTRTVEALTKEFIESKAKIQRKQRYLDALRFSMNRFKKQFGNSNINELTTEDLEKWLDEQSFSLVTRRNYIRDLSMVFKYAAERGYCAENVASRIPKPTPIDKPPEIFTVSEAIQILFAAHSFKNLGLVPFISIGLFAGLRTSELALLDWENINLATRLIEIRADRTKTARRRLVNISDNLFQWLEPYEQISGPVAPCGYEKRIQKLVSLSGLKKWPQNGLRHSFGSYHFAHFQDAPKTSAQMGHSTSNMLFQHYRALVTPESADMYWRILPPAPKESWKINFPQPQTKTKAQAPQATDHFTDEVLKAIADKLPEFLKAKLREN